MRRKLHAEKIHNSAKFTEIVCNATRPAFRRGEIPAEPPGLSSTNYLTFPCTVSLSLRHTGKASYHLLSSVSVPDADTLDKGRAALRFQRPKCDQSRALRMQQVEVFNLIVRPS